MEPCPHLPTSQPCYVCGASYTPSVLRHGFLLSDPPMNEIEWLKMEVPHECDFYVEYFMEDCNK